MDASAKHRGGARHGAGRPPVTERETRTVRTQVLMTPSERALYDLLGGVKWFRQKLIKESK